MNTRYKITLASENFILSCKEDETVMRALCSANAPLHHGCCGGGCGICKGEILSGDYVVSKKMSRAHITADDEKNGIVLLCCIQPRSDLTINIYA